MSKEHRDAVNPPAPKAIPAVPPVHPRAKAIARGDYMPAIGEEKPTWKQVFKGLFKKEK